jgi:ribonuclease HI
MVPSSFPLGEIIRNRNANDRIVKWSVDLRKFEIEFCPRQAIKSQILADFVSEWTEIQMPPPKERPEHWIMYFDDALNLEGAGVGVLLISPQGEQLKYVLQINYKASNNGAEYEALIQGLRIAAFLGIKQLLAFGDSTVVIEQVNKEWDCVKDTMDAYCAEICKLEGHVEGIEFQDVPRNNDVAADVLFKLGSRRALVPIGLFVQDLRKPSIELLDRDNQEPPPHDQNSAPPRDVLMLEKEDDWRKPFIDFILDQLVPNNETERECITQRSANYVMIGTDLYRKAASTGVLMKCILRSEGLQLLAEIHSGEYGCHAASTKLVGKAYRSGFYLPTAMTDAKDLIKRCKRCQLFAKQQHLPAQVLRTIPPSWPFAMWGLDAVGPFCTAQVATNIYLWLLTSLPSGLKSDLKKQSNSSETSSIALVCPIGSSPTWAQLSSAPSFGISIKKIP